MTPEVPKVVLLDRGSLAPNSLNWDAWYDLGIKLEVYENTQPEEVLERARGATVLFSNKVIINEPIIEALPELKFISVMATGTNNIDLNAARKHNIVVSNARNYATESVAQHTWMLILSLSHRLYEYQILTRNGTWSQEPFFALLSPSKTELTDMTLGIIGMGVLGRAVAQKAHAFGMKVCALHSRSTSTLKQDDEVERLNLDDLLERSDVLSLHCPLTNDNAELINKQTLAQMKPGALLINTARGGLVNHQDLLESLTKGHLGGAALDTLEVEPPPADHPLLNASLPNLLITPHHAWGSQRARQALLDQSLENLRAFLNGVPIRTL